MWVFMKKYINQTFLIFFTSNLLSAVPAKLVEDTDSKTNEHSASSGNDNMDLDVEAELDQALSTKPGND